MSCCCSRLMKFLKSRRSYTLQTIPNAEVHRNTIIQQTSHVTEAPETNRTASSPSPPQSPVPKNVKRQGIRGTPNAEKNVDSIQITKHPKEISTAKMLKGALMRNEFLRNLLDEDRLQQVVDAMWLKEVQAKEYVIKEGEKGEHMYVSEDGSFEIIKNGMLVNKVKNWETFGELAILYNTSRFASVKALTKAKIWVLDREIYQKIMLRTAIEEMEKNIDFLKNVKNFEQIPSHILNKISDILQKEFFSTGTKIVSQGERGDKFYIIKAGSVLITKRTQESALEETVGTFRKGEYFGELALIQEDCRQATVIAQAPGVECLTLDRNNFTEYLGPWEEVIKGIYNVKPESSTHLDILSPRTDYSYIRFDDLDPIKTIGVGGFGRVELVQYRSDKKLTFALKYMKKVVIVEQQQQEHVYNEKMIMFSCNSDFVCKLYKTYIDRKFVYLLMELCLGGDVWTLLQKQKNRCFDEKTTKFMSACVIEALDYLHTREIIYRDLKPENLLIDHDGYIKLVDFGFAKRLGARGKTYTFAGTPEYVAPEIILNRGHDKAIDYWALGVFIHELLIGKPPFRGSDHMRTYNLIIRGIDHVDMSKLNKMAAALIRRLCRSVPTDRLGCQKKGIQHIRENNWFSGFDWEQLRNRSMPAPKKPVIKGPIDTTHFDEYPKDTEIPADELSGWDNEFGENIL